MRDLMRLVMVAALGFGAYGLATGVQVDDVVFFLGEQTENAQDFVDDIDLEGETVFRSIDEDDGSTEEVVVGLDEQNNPTARRGSGSFDSAGPNSAVVFALDTSDSADNQVDAPSGFTRPGAQSSSEAAE